MQHRWNDPWLSFHQFKGVEAQHAALSVRREVLKNELLRLRHQQLVGARKEQYEELRAQVRLLEQQVRQYETLNAADTGPTYSNNFGTTDLPLAQTNEQLPRSREALIAKLVQQNEQIMALLVPRQNPPSNTSPHSLSAQNAEDEKATQKEVSAKSPPPPFQPTTSLLWMPELEWTDEDEIALDKLENDADVLPDIPGMDDVNAAGNDHDIGKSTNSATKASDQKAHDRLENRKKLETFLRDSLKSAGGGALRKPRWRRLDATISLHLNLKLRRWNLFRSSAQLYAVSCSW